MALKTRVPQKRLASTFRQKQRDLSSEEWAIYTIDSNIQNAISEYISQIGEGSLSSGNHITWRGRSVPVFFVPFCVAEFLKKNRDKFSSYMSFHRRRRAVSGSGNEYGLWSAWNEGRITPNVFLKQVFTNCKKV